MGNKFRIGSFKETMYGLFESNVTDPTEKELDMMSDSLTFEMKSALTALKWKYPEYYYFLFLSATIEADEKTPTLSMGLNPHINEVIRKGVYNMQDYDKAIKWIYEKRDSSLNLFMLKYNPKYFANASGSLRLFYLLHECDHIFTCTLERAAKYLEEGVPHDMLNISADTVINEYILEYEDFDRKAIVEETDSPCFIEKLVKDEDEEARILGEVCVESKASGNFYFEYITDEWLRRLDKLLNNQKNSSHQNQQNKQQNSGNCQGGSCGSKQSGGSNNQNKSGNNQSGGGSDQSNQQSNGSNQDTSSSGGSDSQTNSGDGNQSPGGKYDKILENIKKIKTLDDHSGLEEIRKLDDNLKRVIEQMIEDMREQSKELVKKELVYDPGKARSSGGSGSGSSAIEYIINSFKRVRNNPLKKIFSKHGQFQTFVQSHMVPPDEEYTYAKPNRRLSHNYPDHYFKGKKLIHKKLDLNVVIDSSQSVETLLPVFLGYLENLENTRLEIVVADDGITQILTLDEPTTRDLKRFKIKGGGGTNLQPGVDYFSSDRRKRIRPMVVITDGVGVDLNFSQYIGKVLVITFEEVPSIHAKPNQVKVILAR